MASLAPEDNTTKSCLLTPVAERPTWVNCVCLIVLVVCGMGEGAGFHQCGMFVPQSFTGQMTFKVWVVMKMFAGAVGSSMLCQGILYLVHPALMEQSRWFASYTAAKQTWLAFVKVVVGGMTLGCGMTLAGSGPTMLPSQIGANVGNAWITLLGLLGGGIVYAIIERVYEMCTADNASAVVGLDEDPPPAVVRVADHKFGIRYPWLVIPGGLIFLSFGILLEVFLPHTADVAVLRVGALPLPPLVGGLIVGFNQIPIRLVQGVAGQGGSTSVMVVIGTLTCGVLGPEYRLEGFAEAWQFTFVWVGTLLGALVASQVSVGVTSSPVGYNAYRSAIGGFLMQFGARVAGGCTCGHGISGFSELSFQSIAAVCSIFSGAIATGYIIEHQ